MAERTFLSPVQINNAGESVETHLDLTLENNALTNEFNCPICLQTLHKAWVVMACLHRYIWKIIECVTNVLLDSTLK